LYPAVSHSFIQREVLALRMRGVDVHTFSIRRSRAEHVLSAADREALTTTHALLPTSPIRLVRVHLSTVIECPSAYSTLRLALRLGRDSRRRLKQLFYFAEAVLLADECRRRQIEHLHAHFGNPSADIALLAAQLAEIPWSFTLHGTDVNSGDRRLLAEKVQRAAFVVCVGDFARRQVLPLVDESQGRKVHVVRCGLDAGWLGESQPPTSAPNGSFRVLSIGRLEKIKGHRILLEALAKLRRKGIPATLVIVGAGPCRDHLERRAADLGVLSRVTFAGSVGQDEIQLYYDSADVFCLPSYTEGVPVVVMEAMARGIPVVASRVAGVPELVKHGVAGLLVAPGMPDELAAALERLAESPKLRASLAHAARRTVESEFTIERSAAELEALFAEAVRR